MPRAPHTGTRGDEVLFLTSQDRLLDAYLRWYAKSYPGRNPQNYDEAAQAVRGLMRHLRVPTELEYQRYQELRRYLDQP